MDYITEIPSISSYPIDPWAQRFIDEVNKTPGYQIISKNIGHVLTINRFTGSTRGLELLPCWTDVVKFSEEEKIHHTKFEEQTPTINHYSTASLVWDEMVSELNLSKAISGREYQYLYHSAYTTGVYMCRYAQAHNCSTDRKFNLNVVSDHTGGPLHTLCFEFSPVQKL
jgi:hypothetical protein